MSSATPPKYVRAKHRLLEMLDSGRFSPGGAFPSEAQLVRRLKVSRPTLIRSLQELVRDGYLVRRQGQGTFVADRRELPAAVAGRGLPFLIARSLADRQGDDRHILNAILDGIGAGLAEFGWRLDLRPIPADLVPPALANDPAWERILNEDDLPVLAYFHDLPQRQWWIDRIPARRLWIIGQPVDRRHCVFIDEEEAGYLATRYLIACGRRRIAMINGADEAYWGIPARREGYRRGLREAGLPDDPRLIRTGNHLLESESGRTAIGELLREKVAFDGLFGATDRRAIGAVAAMLEAGLAVPRDVGVVAMDDTLAGHADPPLSAVHLPFREMGRVAAVHAVSPRLAELHRQTLVRIALQPELVDRRSGGG